MLTKLKLFKKHSDIDLGCVDITVRKNISAARQMTVSSCLLAEIWRTAETACWLRFEI